MHNIKNAKQPLLRLLLCLVLSLAITTYAQTATVQIMSDASLPQDYGETDDLGQLNTSTYSYTDPFIIKVSYSFGLLNAISFSLSGSQANYDLAWRADNGINQPFFNNLGATVFSLLGSANNKYYKNTGILVNNPNNATRYQIGVRATEGSTEDLNTVITLTVTIN